MNPEPYSNLQVHRSDAHVWQRPGWRSRYADQGAALWLASMAGTSLVVYGASRRTASSLWWIAGGATLLGFAAVSLGTRDWLATRGAGTADIVTQESLDSFPASDAPSSNATTATTQPLRNRD